MSRLAIGGSDVLSFEIARLSAESPDDEAWVAKIYFAQVEGEVFLALNPVTGRGQ